MSRDALTLLHTAASHVPRFEALLSELVLEGSLPHVSVQHVVCERLLDDARTRGSVDAVLTAELGAVLGSLARTSAVILCTCSTLGAAAEAFDETFGARVLRVDRPLAREAVARGSRIVVVAALESTLEPTRLLLEEEAARAHKRVALSLSHCEEAWAHFERGDEAAYLRAVAVHVEAVLEEGDVVVLAQASMVGVEALVCTTKPVLSSPRLGLLGALELL